MRLLVRAIVTLSFLIIGALILLIGLAQRESNRFAFLFTNPDGTRCGQPCLFGVSVHSSTADALSVLQAHPKIQPNADLRGALETADAPLPTPLFFISRAETPAFFASFATNGATQKIFFITTIFEKSPPTLGELTPFLGRPIGSETFEVDAHEYNHHLYFARGLIYFEVVIPKQKSISPNLHQTVTALNMFTGFDRNFLIRWKGFVSSGHYRREYERMMRNR